MKKYEEVETCKLERNLKFCLFLKILQCKMWSIYGIDSVIPKLHISAAR